jgi:hypothetical protein
MKYVHLHHTILTFQILLVTGCSNKFNIQQLYALPTYLCVLYLSDKQRLVPFTSYTDWFYNRVENCLQRGTDWVFKESGLRLCHLQHKLIGFYNRDEKCLQRGTDWVFK